MIRYILHPGPVTSRTDGQRHHITALQLALLYGVNMRDCTVVRGNDASQRGYREQPGDIHLRPRSDGDYSLPEAAGVQVKS